MKKCSKCKRDLPSNKYHFYPASNTRDKFHSACKECEGHKFSKPKTETKTGYKECSKCKRELPATTYYFYKDNECLHGVSSICKECRGRKFMVREVFPVINGYRVCNVCRISKPYTKEYFYGDGEGLRADCKICGSKTTKEHYDKNIQHKRKYARDWYYAHCANDAEYKAKNIASSKKYRIANQYTQRYKTSQIVKSQRRRSLKKSLPSTLTSEQWDIIKQHFDNKCAYCGKQKTLAQEHLMPVVSGGEYTHNNIIPACGSCNSSKGKKTFFDWYPKFRHYSKKREKIILSYLNYKKGIQQLTLM